MLGFEFRVSPRNKLKLKSSSLSHKNEIKVENFLKEGETFRQFPPILFKYQADFLRDIESSDFNVFCYEKSRRIGITHALAAYAVLEASKKGGKNFFYISTNRENGKDFINSCQYWALHFQIAASKMQEDLYEDENKDILTLRINFSNNKRIAALASKPSSVRGLQGDILLDEAAFLNGLEEFLKACRALLIWGAKIFIVSTHNGEDSEFNKLIEEVKNRKLDYYHKKTTFREAIKDGLFKRICLVQNQEHSLELEQSWINKIYKDSGSSASEELDVIPKSSRINSMFAKEDFIIIERENLPKLFDNIVIAWDFAATDSKKSCYTVGVLLGKLGNNIYILDWKHCKLDAANTQAFVLDVCLKLDKNVPIFIELEGGSQSRLWLENAFKPSLKGRKVYGVNPQGSKALRAIPFAEKVKNQEVCVVNMPWTEAFLDTIKNFDGTPGVPLITDTGDALSLGYDKVCKSVAKIIASGTVRKDGKLFRA